MTVHHASVIAIVVTYQPDEQVLRLQLESLAAQVDSIVIVDNGSAEQHMLWLTRLSKQISNLTLFAQSENEGIAKAQNIGIRWAKEQGFDFVLFMDQDSLPANDMVALLLATHVSLVMQGIRIAAIGPKFKDIESGRLSKHVKFGPFSVSRINCAHREYTEVDFLISSGSLVSMQALDAIGDMDESLFIDHVDTEWVLRAKSMGWCVYGHCSAMMFHSLGEHRIRFWLGRWRDIPIHKPFRYYYIFRNSVVLHRRSYMGWHWKWVDAIRLLQIIIFMSIVANERRQKIKMIWRGIKDGVRGITGKMSD